MMMPLAKLPTTLVRQFIDAIRMNSHIGKTVASGRSPLSVGKGFEMLYRVSLPKAMSCFSLKSNFPCNSTSVILQIDCLSKHLNNVSGSLCLRCLQFLRCSWAFVVFFSLLKRKTYISEFCARDDFFCFPLFFILEVCEVGFSFNFVLGRRFPTVN